MTALQTREAWQAHIQENWAQYHAEAIALQLSTPLATLVAAVLTPFFNSERDSSEPSHFSALLKLISAKAERDALNRFARDHGFESGAELVKVAAALVEDARSNVDIQRAIDQLILDSRVLNAIDAKTPAGEQLLRTLLDDLWRVIREPSGMRVVVEQITAGGDVVIAGRDSHIVANTYKDNPAALKSYLGGLRAEWNRPDLSRILPIPAPPNDHMLQLHDLFVPLDVWRHDKHKTVTDDALTRLRFQAVNQELDDLRRPVLEAIATHPLLVITGAAGTGKSYLARYVATCLAYACDPDAETRDNVSGLELLGHSWIHGDILPLYVPIRNFTASEHFPAAGKPAMASALLKYLIDCTESFGPDLETYLNLNPAGASAYTVMLILDGLDEVSQTADLLILQRIIENWADRFPLCRVLMTSRAYAYKQNSEWRLSERFQAAELAPFTREQIRAYVRRWYQQTALTRAASFGGKRSAKRTTRALADDLCRVVDDDDSPLLPMMRQPLLLAMLTLLHETHRKLPENRADLYEVTIDLLNRWRPVSEDEKQYVSLRKLNQHRMLNALKLAAFHLQCRQKIFDNHPGTVNRDELRKALKVQQKLPGGLGAAIDTILDDLGTRNGVLLSDQPETYRFPHLSIQEYLAACALIELYDECEMPTPLPPDSETGVWSFPQNLNALLANDPYRWRNVALFVGAIISGNKGQDGRWTLIEELLPLTDTPPHPDETIYRIYIAGEIWAAEYLKARLPSHRLTRKRLTRALASILDSDSLDAPERNATSVVLGQLKRDMRR